MHSLKHNIFVLLASLLMATAGRANPMAVDFAALNAAIADDHVIPGYRTLAASTASLAASLDTLCGQPDTDTLAAARTAYHQAMDGWMAMEHVRIGPIEADLTRQRLYYWPDFRGRGQRQLSTLLASGDDARLAPERIAEASVAVQGLPALERLLFGGEAADFGAAEAPTFRCRLAAAIGRNVAAIGRGVYEGWTKADPPFRTAFVNPLQARTHYLESRQTTAELFRGYYESLKAMEQLKLRKPMGDEAREARPKRFESWRSARSGRNLRLNVASMHDLYTRGFARPLADTATGRQLDTRIETAFEALAAALAVVDHHLPEAAQDPAGHKELELAASYLEVLSRMVGKDLAAVLGLSTGFNSLDGD